MIMTGMKTIKYLVIFKLHIKNNILMINSIKVRVSRRLWTLLIVVFPSASNAEAIIGNTAFFAPDILTLPLRGLPPLITSLSTRCWAQIIFTIHNLNDRIFTAKKLGDSFNFLLFIKIYSFNISFIFQYFFSYIQMIISQGSN